MKLALRPWDATTSFSALPVPVRDAFFPVTTGDGIAIYDPMVLYWSVVLSVILLALARWRRQGWAYLRARWFEVALIGSVVVGSALSIVVNLLLIPSYPLETNRVNVSTAIAIRLTGVLLAVFLIGRLIEHVRREKALPADHD
jgi:cation transport ATPase